MTKGVPTYNQVTENEIKNLLKTSGLNSSKVKFALLQAIKSHKEQKRDTGRNTLEDHIFPVVKDLIQNYKDDLEFEDIVIVALLHDTVEDDKTYSIDKCKTFFDKKICGYVKQLTKVKPEDYKTYGHKQKYEVNKKYLENFKTYNRIVRIIKLADRYNNLLSIHEIPDKEKQKRNIKETIDFILPWAKETSEVYYERIRELVEKINDLTRRDPDAIGVAAPSPEQERGTKVL